jgi:hypothetical protein
MNFYFHSLQLSVHSADGSSLLITKVAKFCNESILDGASKFPLESLRCGREVGRVCTPNYICIPTNIYCNSCAAVRKIPTQVCGIDETRPISLQVTDEGIGKWSARSRLYGIESREVIRIRETCDEGIASRIDRYACSDIEGAPAQIGRVVECRSGLI